MSKFLPVHPPEPKMVALDMDAIRRAYVELVAEHLCSLGEPPCQGRVQAVVGCPLEGKGIHVNPYEDGTFAFIHGRASCSVCGKEDSFTIGPAIEVDNEMVQERVKLTGENSVTAWEFLIARVSQLKALGMRVYTRQQYLERTTPPYKNGKEATWQPEVADDFVTVNFKH